MKLITNTIDEAKENGEPCIKENFEPETIFDHNMKDLTSSVLKGEIVNGSSDSSCKDLKKLNGIIEDQNGVSHSSHLRKPISANVLISLSDCEDISDGELNIIPSDEEENLLADKDSSGNSCRSVVNRSVKKDGDPNSEKIVNGRNSDTSSPNSQGNPKDSKAEIPLSDSCDVSKKETNDTRSSEKFETEIVKFDDIKEVTENVTDTIEICTTAEEIEDSPPVSSQDKSNFIENDEGSDAENDREAKEKLLTLLKETPPELVILPEEHTESEKDLESDSDEAMLSLLEDSQSDSNLNLLNDVIGSSSLTGFESNKEAFENVKADETKSELKKAEDCESTNKEKEIAEDCESTNKEKAIAECCESASKEEDCETTNGEISAGDSKCSTVDLKEQISSKEVKAEVVSNECSEIKEISKDEVSEAGIVEVVLEKWSEIQETSKKIIETSETCSEIQETSRKIIETSEKCSEIQETSTKIIETSEKCCEIGETSEKTEQVSEKCSEIQETSIEMIETVKQDEEDKNKINEVKQESVNENNSNVKSIVSSDETEKSSNEIKLTDIPEKIKAVKEIISAEESSPKICETNDHDKIVENSEITSSCSINIDCDSKKELSDVESPSIKRNLETLLKPENAKKLKRSTSCDEEIEKTTRKRSLSVDNQMNDVNDIKRFRKIIENGSSDKVEESNEELKDHVSEVEIENSEPEKKSEENEVVSCKVLSSDKSVTSTSEQKSSDASSVDSESVESMDVSESEKTVKDSEEMVEKSEKTIENCAVSPSQENPMEINKRLPNETKIDDSVPSSKDDTKDNVSSSSERVAHGPWKSITKDLSLITKIHKDKFKSLTRWDLEELIVQKICESIADRSVIGELRQRVKSLENAIDNWRKKSTIIEKSNREMRTVLNRYLKEVDDNIADKSKPLIPIRITRSVGLQVSPPMNPDKFKGLNRLQSQKRHDNIRTLRPNAASVNNTSSPVVKTPLTPVTQRNPPVATRTIVPKTPPKQQVIPNSHKVINTNSPRRVPQVNTNNDVINPPTGAVVAGKRIVASTPVITATANASSASSDLEVIDLTDKEERNMARGVVTTNNVQFLPRAAGNTIGISTATVGPQMTFMVPTSAMQAVRGNQRQQLILTTTTTNGTTQIRPVTSATVVTNRPNSSSQTLSIPGAVVMKGGTFVPITSQAPAGVVVRSANSTILSRNVQQLRLASPVTVQPQPISHPAPLPPPTSQISYTLPKPVLKVTKTSNGIMLSWSMTLTKNHDEIASYQLYAYQESSNIPPNSNLWKKVGDVKALPLPMACTLTQFVEGHKYHFAVRAVDVFSRVSQFSFPSTILLK